MRAARAPIICGLVLGAHESQTSRLCGAIPSSRPTTERKPVHVASSSRRPHRMGKEKMEGRGIEEDVDAQRREPGNIVHSSGASAKGFHKGKGRGRLLAQTAEGSIFD